MERTRGTLRFSPAPIPYEHGRDGRKTYQGSPGIPSIVSSGRERRQAPDKRRGVERVRLNHPVTRNPPFRDHRSNHRFEPPFRPLHSNHRFEPNDNHESTEPQIPNLTNSRASIARARWVQNHRSAAIPTRRLPPPEHRERRSGTQSGNADCDAQLSRFREAQRREQLGSRRPWVERPIQPIPDRTLAPESRGGSRRSGLASPTL